VNVQTIAMILGGIFVAWFAAGMIYNLRRGDAILRWMQAGLPSIGPRTTFRWLGSTVAEMGIAQAKRPFRRMDVLLVFRPRDVVFLWVASLFQGRDDTLILRAHLSSVPLLDLELADPKTWTGRMEIHRLQERNWEEQDYQGLKLLAPKGLLRLAEETLNRLEQPMQAFSGRYVRFGLRKEAPHLLVHVPMPKYKELSASEYFEALRGLGQTVSEHH
jgi:hypothetical protein